MLSLSKKEPDCFIVFKKKNSPKNYEVDCDYKVRECLKDALLEEQNRQCFYCEQKINKSHIEHFIPRDANVKNTECDYNNLFLSCNAQNHCGIKKDNKYDESMYIRIFSTNIEQQENPLEFFDYTTQGKIKVKKLLSDNKKSRANNTIELLNLNHTDLINARKTMFKNIDSCIQSNMDIKSIYSFFNEFENIFKRFGEI